MARQSFHFKSNKYGNIRTVYNGKSFASKKEANRAMELDILLHAGVISRYTTQYKFPIAHNGVKICTYYADFEVEYPDGKIIYEDTKGMLTTVYKLKKKLVKAFYGVDIIEI